MRYGHRNGRRRTRQGDDDSRRDRVGAAAARRAAGCHGSPRATAHRLATALEMHGLLRRDDDGRFELGPHLVTLGQAAAGRFALIAAATPVLRALRDATGESVQLFVREGDARRCVISLESPHGLRWIVPEGSLLPLDLGSSGRVLLGDTAEAGWVESIGEREPGVASVSAPVVDAARRGRGDLRERPDRAAEPQPGPSASVRAVADAAAQIVLMTERADVAARRPCSDRRIMPGCADPSLGSPLPDLRARVRSIRRAAIAPLASVCLLVTASACGSDADSDADTDRHRRFGRRGRPAGRHRRRSTPRRRTAPRSTPHDPTRCRASDDGRRRCLGDLWRAERGRRRRRGRRRVRLGRRLSVDADESCLFSNSTGTDGVTVVTESADTYLGGFVAGLPPEEALAQLESAQSIVLERRIRRRADHDRRVAGDRDHRHRRHGRDPAGTPRRCRRHRHRGHARRAGPPRRRRQDSATGCSGPRTAVAARADAVR